MRNASGSDSEQHNERSLGTRRTGGARTNNRAPGQEIDEIARYLSSSVHPVAFPPYIESRMVVLNVFSLGRALEYDNPSRCS